ncbi:MAG: replication protein [bacterium]|nr:replication protein [bacterium]
MNQIEPRLNQRVGNNGLANFTILPNPVYEKMLVSNLPVIERELVILVNRYSLGFGLSTAVISTQMIRKFIPIHPSRINRVITKLIEKKILNGKPYRQRKNGAVEWYELSVNPNISEWNVKRFLDKERLLEQINYTAMKRKHGRRDFLPDSCRRQYPNSEPHPSQTRSQDTHHPQDTLFGF